MKTLLYVVGALCVVGLAWWVIPVTKEPAAAPSAPKPPDAKAMQDFVVHPIRFAPFCFWTTQFPSCDFDDPETVRGLIGPYTITCSFYDGEGKPVTSAEKPGRYAAVVEVHRSDGVTSKRLSRSSNLWRTAGWPSRGLLRAHALGVMTTACSAAAKAGRTAVRAMRLMLCLLSPA